MRLSPGGYGMASVKENGKWRARRVHRVVWAEVHGPIPEGMFVCHHCDNPPCINIDHLFLGTPADNMRDRDAKGRNARGLTHWHKLTAEEVWAIRDRLAEENSTQEVIAREFGVSQVMVSRIYLNRSWRSLTERF